MATRKYFLLDVNGVANDMFEADDNLTVEQMVNAAKNHLTNMGWFGGVFTVRRAYDHSDTDAMPFESSFNLFEDNKSLNSK